MSEASPDPDVHSPDGHSPDGHSPEKRRQILDGAARVFTADGYGGASMSRIAAAAGVSKGTLYNYFAGKAELFTAWVGDECDRKLVGIFGGAIPPAPGAALREIGIRMVRMMTSPDGLAIHRVVFAEAEKFPEVAHAFWEAGPARGIAAMAGLLRRQAGAGALAVPDAAFAAEQFWSLCQTRLVIRRQLAMLEQPGDAEVAQVVDAAVAMFLRTYAAASPSPLPGIMEGTGVGS